MTPAAKKEFITIDLLLNSCAKTRAVDAFSLSWIKLERQLRRLNSNLLYQASIFTGLDNAEKEAIRAAFHKKKTSDHKRFLRGLHKLSGLTAKDLIGDRYRELKQTIDSAYKYRNKIFHGLNTGSSLNREDLIELQKGIRDWCFLLADGGDQMYGYDGFSDGSISKTNRPEITLAVDNAVKTLGWKRFVAEI